LVLNLAYLGLRRRPKWPKVATACYASVEQIA
jgi:hypothetical protein